MVDDQAIIIMIIFIAAGYLSFSRHSSKKGSLVGERTSSHAPLRVLILTSATGGGHEAVGQAMREELEEAGHSVVMKDGLQAMSRTLDWLLVRGYAGQVRNAPRSLRISFALTSRRWGAAIIRAIVSLLFANRLLEVIAEERLDLVVSTYPLITAALGRLRRSGRLKVPTVALIADYGAHPLWVTPVSDLHIVVSHRSAELVRRAGGRVSTARLPVGPGFRSTLTCQEARALLGLPRDAFVALIIGGALGIGDLEGAARCAAESGAYTVVVTGNNEKLEARLEEEFRHVENVQVLGWREDIPVLMTASDCLIQNAGGMTCIEAIETGLPIIFFNPIRGHGELNARIMEQVGVARWMHTSEDLRALLRSLVRRETSLLAPNRETVAPTASAVLESLAGSDAPPVPHRRIGRLRVVLTGVAALLFCSWVAFSSPAMALAAKSLSLRVPGYDPPPGEISLGVKVTDPKTAAAFEGLMVREKLPVTIFSNTRGAEGLYPVAHLAVGVAEEPSSGTFSSPWEERKEARNAAVAIQRATGEYPQYFLPAPQANLAALADAPTHTQLVIPEETGKASLHPGLVIIETSNLALDTAELRLERTLHKVRREGFRCVSLAQL